MAYLILSDYYSQIQIQNLAQLIGSNNNLLASAAQKAQEQCASYLVQKYDLLSELTDTNIWSLSKTYNANDRVYLDATAYDQTLTYSLNALTLQAGNVYICSTAITVPETFDQTHWTLLGAQYTLFYVKYPNPVFNYQLFYSVDDQVFWKGKVYTCLIASSAPTHDVVLQSGTTSNEPFVNVFPDDNINGLIYWGTGTPFSVTSGTLPTDTTFWEQKDNRSQQLLEILIDITLYKIHSRISPRNIPDLRVLNYQHAIDWLKDAGQGKITANLPVIQPSQGRRIRMGSNVKNINSY